MRRVGIGLLMLALGLTAFAPAGNTTHSPQIPCGDPAGCPDIIVDPVKMVRPVFESRNFAATSCSVVEGHTEPGLRRLLRFTFTQPNIGDGDLVVGAPAAHPEWFDFPTCHGHFHFKEYADYRLWTVDGYLDWVQLRLANPDTQPHVLLEQNPALAAQMVAGNKNGFCVIDLVFYGGGLPQYVSCNSNQGISVGWADEYHYTLDGQWVDITGVAPGLYVLEGEVNPERFYVETDYTNNAQAVPVVIPPG